MDDKVKILGIAGSLRKGSYNKKVLRAASDLTLPNTEIVIFDIKDIPLYNEDIEKPLPKPVLELKRQIISSDAILFVTPEYNYSIPGVLKNVIDWGSRPFGDNSWNDKPVAIIGASPGGFGTIRAQMQLRQTFIFTNMHPINHELFISHVADKFDENSSLTDDDLKAKIADIIKSLTDWTNRLNK